MPIESLEKAFQNIPNLCTYTAGRRSSHIGSLRPKVKFLPSQSDVCAVMLNGSKATIRPCNQG